MGLRPKQKASQEVTSRCLLASPTVVVRDTDCCGSHRDRSLEECTTSTQLVFPYRGVYVRHVGSEEVVAEANQVVFFNAFEAYRVSHPVAGGDASLTIILPEERLRELAPHRMLNSGSVAKFRYQRLRIDARAQVLVALLGHSLRTKVAVPMEAESLALTLVQRSLGPRTSHTPATTYGRQKLVARAKLVLASDLSRRWSLAEIAAEVRVSPVYLTQIFQQVEGIPLYRYQLRLRLARALDLVGRYEDLTTLGLDLGFSSHSHFSAAFRETYGRTPSEFRQSALRR